MRASRLDCMFVNLGILQHNSIYSSRSKHGARIYGSKVRNNTRDEKCIHQKRSNFSQQRRERARVSKSRKGGFVPFFPYSGSHKSANKVGRLPHLLRQLSTSLRREKKAAWDGPRTRLAKIRSQMIDPVKRRYTRKYALSRTNRSTFRTLRVPSFKAS